MTFLNKASHVFCEVLWRAGRSGGKGKEGETFASRELSVWARWGNILEPIRRKNVAQVLRK
jgi:hypothetical protein